MFVIVAGIGALFVVAVIFQAGVARVGVKVPPFRALLVDSEPPIVARHGDVQFPEHEQVIEVSLGIRETPWSLDGLIRLPDGAALSVGGHALVPGARRG